MTSLWNEEDTKRILRIYRDRFTRHPIDGNLRQNHTKIIEELFLVLRDKGFCKRVEYTGSAYTGLEIGPDREFDVTFILNGENLTFTKQTKRGEHFFVNPTSKPSKYEDCVSSIQNGKKTKQFLDPKKFQDKFASLFEDAQGICDRLGFGYKVEQKTHGAGIQWDVFDRETNQKLYSVDLVPSIEEESAKGRQFVAKPSKAKKKNSRKHFLWRQSFSTEDKEALGKISEGNKCQKDIVRTLKAVLADRGGHCGLQRMRSYLVYTAVLHENERITNPDLWGEELFPERLRDTLQYWQDCMDESTKFMAHPFLPGVNLIEGWKEGTYIANKNRIRRILNVPKVFNSIFVV